MFIEDDSAWPGVGFNPAKGDLDQIQALASDVKSVGDELDELDHMLKSIGRSDGAWEGEAARNFAKKLGELPKYLHQGSESMHDCAKALRGWHTHLQGFQDKAGNIEAEAASARHRLKSEQAQFESLKKQYDSLNLATVDANDPGFKQLMTNLGDARDAANGSKEKLEHLIREAERIHAQWKDRAGEAERAILKASENHPPDIHWWNKAIDGLKAGFRAFTDWLVDHADLLSTISSGLAAAALACEFVPVVGTVAGGVLAGASAVCAAGAMAGHWIGNARGNGTPGWKIGLDALGVIPGVGGIAKSAVAGAKTAVGAAEGASLLGRAAAGAKGLARGEELGQKIYDGVRAPLSQKGINMLLKGRFPEGKVPTAVEAGIQLPIKAGSFIHGAAKQLSGEEEN
ncbi:WXG100 family type VII secretion target [Streptomyces sp. NPDC090442]|uniref:WXG100 family type VII secretion target n=1 Tax=Streptomyces sp. NPDC090442 TaxID=3365962 RepID=UPI0038081AA1